MLQVEGYTTAKGERLNTHLNSVSPGYFGTVGQRLLGGRDFDAGDAANAGAVAIVNQSFVRKYFPNGDALGRTFALPAAYKAPRMAIVGVVEDARYRDLRGPTPMGAYFPAAQAPDHPESLEV